MNRLPFITDLDTPLIKISSRDHWSLRDAFQSLHSWGGIGSGKTSGSGKAIAAALLRGGFGGLVLTAKYEEIQLWVDYARANGREKWLVFFDETKGFNFLDWELARNGVKGIGNVIESMMHILEFVDNAMGTGGKSSEPFWDQASRLALNHIVPLVFSAWGKVTIADIVTFVVSVATKPDQYIDPSFIAQSFAAQTMRKAVDDPAVRLDDAEMKRLLDYWFNQHTKIPERTKGNIDVTLGAKLDRFRHGRLRDMFCGKTTICPEMLFHGAIVIMCCPVLTFNDDAIIAQQLFKYCVQKAIESRNGLDPRQQMRPVYIYADENQYFLNNYDDTFISTARSCKASVICLSQSIASYYSRAGKEKTDAVDGFINKFNTQVFHLNSCNRTNSHASQSIGKDLLWRTTQGRSVGSNTSKGMNQNASENRGTNSSSGSSYGGNSSGFNSNSGSNYGSGETHGMNVGTGTSESENWSESQQNDVILEPRYFASELLSGGPKHNHLVTAVWYKAGARFEASGTNWLRVTFRQ
jgi:hypothetical protein